MWTACVDIQGLSLSRKYIPKEITIQMTKKINEFLPNPPQLYCTFSTADYHSINFIEKRVNGLLYSLGYVD